MPLFTIDKKTINKHPKLRDELKQIAKSIEAEEDNFIYRTDPDKYRVFIERLNAYHIAFYLKNS
jgi:hypothetical protein